MIKTTNVALEVHQGTLVCYRQKEIAKPVSYGEVIEKAVGIARALVKQGRA